MARRSAIVIGIAAVGVIALGAPPASATLPGTNGKIVFGQVFPNYGFTIDPDGSDKHEIGPAGNTTCVNWSPDGSEVLCNLWSEDGVQPATANADGSGFMLLNPNLPLDLFCLSSSPDGARLLCHSEGMANPADAGLYTVRSSDAGDLVRVAATPPNGFDNGYGYSPDGSRVLFARYDSDDNGTLFSANPDGSGALQLSPPGLSVIDLGFSNRVGADWSPDGSRVTFAGFQKRSPGPALFVVNADGTALRRITPPGLFALSAQWSPNGEWIAFTGHRRVLEVPELWIVRPDGTGGTKIALDIIDRLDRRAFKKLKKKFVKQCKKKSGNVKQCKRKAKQRAKKNAASARLTPVWSPDSTKLLFQRLSRHGKVELWTVNADGTGLSKLTPTRSLAQYAWGTAPPGGSKVSASPVGAARGAPIGPHFPATGVAVDDSHVWWAFSARFGGGIARANLDGPGAETVIRPKNFHAPKRSSLKPGRVACLHRLAPKPVRSGLLTAGMMATALTEAG